MTRPSKRLERCFDKTMVVHAKRVAAVTLAALAVTAQAQTAPAPAQRSAGQGPSDASIEALFKRVDTNGDGQLSAEEATRLPAISARFDEIDADRDGQLNASEFHTGATAPMR